MKPIHKTTGWGDITKEIHESPVLLFPGLGASRLVKHNHDIYPPSMQEYALHFRKWKTTMMHDRDLTTLPLGNKRALDLTLPFFNHINYYKTLLNDPNTYPIPYDFRQIDNADYLTVLYHNIRKYIEGFQEPVTFLCHSSGGLVAHWFLHCQTEAWRQQNIRSVIYVNVPFGGVVSVLEHCVSEETSIGRFLGKDIFQSLGASVWNMPDLRYLNRTVLTVDGNPVDDYFSFFELNNMKKRYQENRHIIDAFKYPTGVSTRVIYSTSREPNITLERLDVTLRPKKTWNHYKIVNRYGPGDGVVCLDSLLVPYVWDCDNVFYHHLPNTEHSNVFS